MDFVQASAIFKGLRHPVRLRMYTKRPDAEEAGLTVGEPHRGH